MGIAATVAASIGGIYVLSADTESDTDISIGTTLHASSVVVSDDSVNVDIQADRAPL